MVIGFSKDSMNAENQHHKQISPGPSSLIVLRTTLAPGEYRGQMLGFTKIGYHILSTLAASTLVGPTVSTGCSNLIIHS